MVKELADQVLSRDQSLNQGLVSRFHHPRYSLVMAKTSNRRHSIDGTTQCKSTYDYTTAPRMLQEQEGSGFSIQKDEPKKPYSQQQSYFEKTSQESYQYPISGNDSNHSSIRMIPIRGSTASGNPGMDKSRRYLS